MCLMALHHQINLYDIRITQNSSEHAYIHHNSININFLDFESINAIHNYKEKTKMEITSSTFSYACP